MIDLFSPSNSFLSLKSKDVYLRNWRPVKAMLIFSVQVQAVEWEGEELVL